MNTILPTDTTDLKAVAILLPKVHVIYTAMM